MSYVREHSYGKTYLTTQKFTDIITIMSAFSRFSVPSLEELPEDIRSRIAEVTERSGFTPNVLMALARRPDEFRAFFAYRDAIMDRGDGLTKAEREMIVVATSATVNCTYCLLSHGSSLRILTKDPYLSDQLTMNYRAAPLTKRHRAMLDYAVKLSLHPQEISDDDQEVLRELGFDDEDIWDISSVVAFFALSNRMVHAMALKPNSEFFNLGRFSGEGA
ncbi:MAG TPA: peroxidase-related enzyme [Acidimicrobiales bacterium]|nr:peroxidase-related enzyme [Acidimicrobiales bacterium]